MRSIRDTAQVMVSEYHDRQNRAKEEWKRGDITREQYMAVVDTLTAKRGAIQELFRRTGQ